MKKLSAILGLAFLCSYSSAQKLVLPAEPELKLRELNGKDTTYYLHFTVQGMSVTDLVKVSVKDYDKGTARLQQDYEYTPGSLNEKELSLSKEQLFTIGIIVKGDNIKEAAEPFEFELTFAGTQLRTETIKITIDDPKAQEKQASDTSKWKVSIVTGANFDFFDDPVFKKFAGELRVYTPFLDTISRHKKGKSPISVGLHAGIFNYRYFEADTSKGNIRTEYYLVDPTNRALVADSTRMMRETYALNSNVSYNNWGAYLNPMIGLKSSKWYDLGLDLHLELIWRTRIQNYTKVGIRTDSLHYTKSDSTRGLIVAEVPSVRALYTKKEFFDSYFGIGLPLDLNIKELFRLHIKPTIGITNFQDEQIKEEIVGKVRYRQFVIENDARLFGLLKFQLTTSVAPVELVLGGEIRKIRGAKINNQDALRAFYLGALLKLDAFKK